MLSYYQALRAIFARMDFERGPQPPYAERVWRLGRMEELLEQLGSPQRAFASVHIAGTKGKGSTTAMVESMLRHAGYSTGMYTSPHLHTFRERIRKDGQPIPEATVCEIVERMLPILEARPQVTVFEAITALAMTYYAQAGVQIGVFEVGMGGRLDATNVLCPEVCVITTVSMDHMNVLGPTLEAIAGEKAGIIKPGTPVVVGPQRPEALEVIRRRAAQENAPCILVGADWSWRLESGDLSGQTLSIFRDGHEAGPEYPDLRLPLLGDHQLENACAAVAAIEVLRSKGWAIPEEAVRAGLAAVEWPGRLEVLSREPLIVVDGAHNVDSTTRLLQAVRMHLPHRRLHLVFGAGGTHNPRELLEILLPASDRVYVTRSRHAKATPPADLAAAVADLGGCAESGQPAVLTDSVAEALSAARAAADPEDLVLVTGSLFVVAEAREAWARMQGLPPYPFDPEGSY